MNRFQSSIVLMSVLAAILKLATSGVVETKCKGQTIQINEDLQADIKDCLTSIGIATKKETTATNLGCFSRCTMIKKGLIDEFGKPHKEKIINMMDTHIPENIRNEWKPAIETCLDNEGSKIDMNDEKCASFQPLTMCFHNSFLRICKG